MNAPQDTPSATRSADLLRVLSRWAESGVLRRLEAALARFLASLCPQIGAETLFAVVVLADLEGRGHTCVLLDELPQHAAGLLQRAQAAALPLPVLDLPDADGWQRVLSDCPLVWDETAADDSGAPLVLGGCRLYLRRYWDAETQVARQLRARMRHATPVDTAAAAAVIAALFAPPTAAAVDWQRLACALALRSRLTLLTGGPGTGKTYTAARLLAALVATAHNPAAVRVALAAPTGKAAARLKQAIDQALLTLPPLPAVADLAARLGPARTLHSLLGARSDSRRFARNSAQPLEVDVLLIDEASMVHLEMMAAVLDALPPTARLILLGDKDQLASVEAGAVLGELCADAEGGHYWPDTAQQLQQLAAEQLPAAYVDAQGSALSQHVVMLRESRRFGGSIGKLAAAVRTGQADIALRLLQSPPDEAVRQLPPSGHLYRELLQTAVAGRGTAPGYAHYAALLQQGPAEGSPSGWAEWARQVLLAFERCRVLCAVRDGPWGVDALNAAIARELDASGLLRSRGAWYAGRPVLVTRNDHDLGVLNGDVGIVLPSPDGRLRVAFTQEQTVRSVSLSRLTDVQTAFAMTVHQSQGSEFDHTVLVLPEYSATLSRELLYTGITRARSAFTLACAQAQTLRDGIARVTRRSSGLRWRLDTLGTP
jgi:exodeoxyribonuclease V alpha subunit